MTDAVTSVSVMGGNFTTITGTAVTVRFTAVGGATPFNGGTSAVATVPGTVVSPNQVDCAPPIATICGGSPVQATVDILFPSGVIAPSTTPIVTFQPPTISALNGSGAPSNVPSTVLLGAGGAGGFTITGTGFGPVGGTAQVTFGDPAGMGSGFNGAPSVTVPGNIVSDTLVTGTLPTITAPRLTADLPADVTVVLPSGSCATSPSLSNWVAPPTITTVTNNRPPFDQTNVALTKPQTFLPVVPTDTDIDGTAFDPGLAHLIYDTGAGPGTPIGSGFLSSPVVTGTNISGICPTDPTMTATTATTVRVVNPDNQFHEFPISYSVSDVLPNVNTTRQAGINAETVVVVNPTNPANAAIFVHADRGGTLAFDEMTVSYTTDYGATWTITTIDDAVDGFGAGDLRFDPAAAFDRFGNLYVCYGVVGGGLTSVVILQSADGGATFGNLRILAQHPGFSHDRWTMATGLEPVSGGEAIYASWTGFYTFPYPAVVNGCVSTGLGNLGAPFAPAAAPVVVTDGAAPSLQWQNAYPEVGPNGELYMIFFDIPPGAGPAPGDVWFDVDPDGLWDATNGFGTDQLIATSNIGWRTYIPPQPQRGFGINPQIVSIHSGPNAGRLVLCYTQEVPDDQTVAFSGSPTPNSNTLVVVRTSDNQGVTWSAETQVHIDTPEHQFMHWLTCDRATGELYVTWYDCRNDSTNNVLTERMGASSSDGGATWTPILQLAQGQSDASSPAAPLGQDYLEYCGTAAYNGVVYAAWTDFSNFTGDNPDGTSRSDVFVSVYMQR
ncbi:MAG: sialidase family protein [Planctomycetota bacterium]|nr:sialidase family protein [Planctomycetota bacterium]